MARLARVEPGMTVLDPCCDAGTITVETAEATVAGSDLDPRALAASTRNTLRHKAIALANYDASRLPMRAGSVDRIVTNSARGRQVAQRWRFPALLAECRHGAMVTGRRRG